MNVEHINPFIEATQLVLDTMVHVPYIMGKAQLRTADHRAFKFYRVSATIQITGSIHGMVVLNLSESVARCLAGGLLGQAPKEVDKDCMDALGEIANMIAGNAKKSISRDQLSLSIPTVVDPTEVCYPQDVPVISIPFDTSAGRFEIDVAFWNACSTRAEGFSGELTAKCA